VSRLDLQARIVNHGNYGLDYATSLGTVVSGASGVWGNWVEIIPALPATVNGFFVICGPQFQNPAYGGFLRIGAGATGSERQISREFLITADASGKEVQFVKAHANAGERISVSLVTAPNTYLSLIPVFVQGAPLAEIVHSSMAELGGVGSDTAIAFPYPTADNASTAWTEICAACPAEVDLALVGLANVAGDRTGGEGDESIIVELGVGAAGSETRVSAFHTRIQSWSDSFNPSMFEIPVAFSKGDRVSVRWQSDAATLHTPWTLGMRYTFKKVR